MPPPDDDESPERAAAFDRCLDIVERIHAEGELVLLGPPYLNREFDAGYLAAAERIILGLVDDDYPPLKAMYARWMNARLQRALGAVGGREPS